MIFMLKYPFLFSIMMVGCLHRKQGRKVARIAAFTLLFTPSLQTSIARHFLSTYYIYYKYKMFSWKKFSKEHVFATLWPILKNVSSGKLNRDWNIVKTKLSNVWSNLKRSPNEPFGLKLRKYLHWNQISDLYSRNTFREICNFRDPVCTSKSPGMGRARTFKNIRNITWYSHFRHAISIPYAPIMSRNRG